MTEQERAEGRTIVGHLQLRKNHKRKKREGEGGHQDGWTMSTCPKEACTEDTHETGQDSVANYSSEPAQHSASSL